MHRHTHLTNAHQAVHYLSCPTRASVSQENWFQGSNWKRREYFPLLVLLMAAGPIWGRLNLLHVCKSSPHWQQLTIIQPDHWPIRTGLPWLPEHTRALTSHLPTVPAYSRHGEKDGRNGEKTNREIERDGKKKWKKRLTSRMRCNSCVKGCSKWRAHCRLVSIVTSSRG